MLILLHMWHGGTPTCRHGVVVQMLMTATGQLLVDVLGHCQVLHSMHHVCANHMFQLAS
jgi:hypothetical protein